MSEVTGRSRQIASRHGSRAPMTPLVILQRPALPLIDERPEPACGCTARRWPRPSQSTRTEPRSTMIAALGFAAATLSTTVVWPQVWLSCRHGRTLGLSPTGSWLPPRPPPARPPPRTLAHRQLARRRPRRRLADLRPPRRELAADRHPRRRRRRQHRRPRRPA